MVSQIFHRFSSTKKVCGDYCEGLSRETHTHTRQFCSLSVDFLLSSFLFLRIFLVGPIWLLQSILKKAEDKRRKSLPPNPTPPEATEE